MTQSSWTINDQTGFLLAVPSIELSPEINHILNNLADLLADGTIREAIHAVPLLNEPFKNMNLIESKHVNTKTVGVDGNPPEKYPQLHKSDPIEHERYFQAYSYLASAYLHAPNLPKTNTIPKPIALPLVTLANSLKRPPILAYASYTLANWRKQDLNGAIEVENLELLYKFLHKRDAAWFTLIHVEIEAEAAPAIDAIHPMTHAVQHGDNASVANHLNTIAESLQTMMATLRRMPEHCHPNVYYNEVRPYIFGFENVIFEGCYDDQPQSFAGETGAQSSVIPALIRALGVHHQETTMTKYLDVMQQYMPYEHRQFLQQIDQHIVRQFIQQADNAELRDTYNYALECLLEFRQLHLRYAASYIANQADDTRGTGGTEFMTWLQRLIDETSSQML